MTIVKHLDYSKHLTIGVYSTVSTLKEAGVMKTLGQYFDEAAAITGSDRQTALRIGIAPNRISMARKTGQMGNEFCVHVAEIIHVDPLEIIAAAEVQKHPEKRKFWAKWIAATVIMSAGIMTQDVDYSAVYAAHSTFPAIYYAHIALVLSLIVFYNNIRSKKLVFDYDRES